MTKKELLNKIQKEINEKEEYLKTLNEDNDKVLIGITLGEINGLLTAKLYVYDLEK